MNTPTTSNPCCFSIHAATAESTPPDMPTTTRSRRAVTGLPSRCALRLIGQPRPWDGPAGSLEHLRAARSGIRPWGGPAGSCDLPHELDRPAPAGAIVVDALQDERAAMIGAARRDFVVGQPDGAHDADVERPRGIV